MNSIIPYMMAFMNSTTQVTAHFFLLAISFGTQLFSPVVSTKLTGVGFYRLGTGLVLAALTLALGVDFFMEPGLKNTEIVCYSFLLISHILGFVFHKDQKSWGMWVLYGLQLNAFSILIFTIFLPSGNWIVFFMLSMALLGISNFSMLLGHYYLVVPKLSEEPLIYCLYIFWTTLFFKIMLSLSVLLTSGKPFLEEGNLLGDGYLYNWLFISMRYLWGYLAPMILSFFTFRLCKLRSIQSATGVLYIIEFFVIVGELISVYLMAKHGLAL